MPVKSARFELCVIGCLKAADAGVSPERALERLRRIQHHAIRFNAAPYSGVSTLAPEHAQLLRALNVSKPDASGQLALL